MRIGRHLVVLAAMLATVPSAATAQARLHLVACAPGYPGSTEQAQPTMDGFAAMLAAASGWENDALSAEYRPDEAGGVERLGDGDAALALVPLPFFLKHERELALTPIAQAVLDSGVATESWSLVARAGAITSPADLAGHEIVGIPGYAPAFVRGPVLAAWGSLPDDTAIVATGRVLGALRRVTAGERVAVLLDGPQTEALPALPFAEELQVVNQSPPLLSALIVGVGERLDDVDRAALGEGLLRVGEDPAFAEVLGTLRLVGFESLDHDALAAARNAFQQAGSAAGAESEPR